jgi:hypothetical protein
MTLTANQTFFDEALVLHESLRGMELADIRHMSIEELLDQAVRHELGHAHAIRGTNSRLNVLPNNCETASCSGATAQFHRAGRKWRHARDMEVRGRLGK